ncbi:uncharacterized protein EI90DRAFT_3048935 [Cantharellus anzutake]|uniref:uncharacterized protein n=1 Tax=Cantharellus anzutake TaxID=1750568 RepID=UPI001903D511|nr:uncharacterized protein EI90DRAFT_3048935 [Cantharellus anzutake]KAF8334929.1 hypothetical protein EI90DRAFT_3048935 [Cantharellus anzutake]
MPTDRKSHHFFSRTKPQQAPETPDDRPQAPTPNIQVTVSATENDRPIRVDYNQSAGSHPGTLSASGTSKDDAAQQRTRLRDRISDLFRRSPSPDSNRRTQSSTLLGNNFLTSSVQASPGDPPPFLSPLPAKVNTGGIPTALVGDDDASVPTQHEFVDLRPSVLAVSSVPAEPASRRSDGAWKDIIVSGTKVSLQTAATALKLVPIPNLDQLPNTLLSWIRIYENVSGNTEELSQLGLEKSLVNLNPWCRNSARL